MAKKAKPKKGASAAKKKGALKLDAPEPATGPANRSRRQNISIRQIANGYVTSVSGNDRKGNYVERETFSKRQPKVVIAERGTTK